MSSPFDTRDLRNAFGRFATGVTVITAGCGEDIHGMTANSFASVSLEPAMLLVCVANKARAHGVITEAEAFGVSVLADDQVSVSKHFAGTPEIDDVEFDDLGGVPTIRGALAQFGCSLAGAHSAGDHTILVGKIEGYSHRDGKPLLFHRGLYSTID